VEVDPLKIVLVDLTTRAILTSAVCFIFSRILNIAQKDDKKFLGIPGMWFQFCIIFCGHPRLGWNDEQSSR
jgi:hypothetical protein